MFIPFYIYTWLILNLPSCCPCDRLAFFKAAYDMFDADFYVKADDAIYLRPGKVCDPMYKNCCLDG